MWGEHGRRAPRVGFAAAAAVELEHKHARTRTEKSPPVHAQQSQPPQGAGYENMPRARARTKMCVIISMNCVMCG